MQPHRNKLMKMVGGGEKLSHISLGTKLPLMTKILLEIQFQTSSYLVNPPEVSTAEFGHHHCHQECMSLEQ